jgi:hypothetical protein
MSNGDTARRYALLDANVVAGYFIPTAVSPKAHKRGTVLVEAVRNRAVDDVVLYIPNVCIPEVFGVFAKYAYGHWNRQVKKTIHGTRYRTICNCFHEHLRHGAVYHQYELNRYHVLATDLISPVDHRFRISRDRKSKKNVRPMGATDHLIVAMGMVLSRIHGRENVILLTTDGRMVKAVERAANMNRNTARSMGLPERATSLGYTWGPKMYPQVINLTHAADRQLKDFFGEWPLPTEAPRGTTPRAAGI